jgi:hypothetical protein
MSSSTNPDLNYLPKGFSVDDPGYMPPAEDGSKLKVIVKPILKGSNCGNHSNHGKE